MNMNFLKQKNKSILGRIFTLMIFAMLVVSCTQEESNVKTDLEQDGIQEYSYEYSECVELKDGDFYVEYCVKSDSREKIDYVLSMQPSIEVVPYTASNQNLEDFSDLDQVSENLEKPVISESIVGGNIPSGYKLSFVYAKNVDESNQTELRSSSNHEFTNTGAIGIHVSEGGHQLYCKFYSRGCCWYSSGWYYRGGRTISPYHTNSHNFYSTAYTSKPGAKMKSYTTTTAWNATTKWFLY